jgi:hypothetical protein
MAGEYTPPIDVAFKKRLTDKFGLSNQQNIVADIVNMIPDSSLVVNEQRMILPDSVIQGLGHDTMEKIIVSVVLNGEIQNKQGILTMRTLGQYLGKTIYGILIELSDYGVDADNTIIKEEAIEDAPLPEDWEEGNGG